MNHKQIKAALLGYCNETVQLRFTKIKQTIKGIEESLFSESKSSAGDKHETARAMLQIDRENTGKQLREVEQLLAIVRKIDITSASKQVRLGSLVHTSNGTYFISISVGQHIIEKASYYCIAWKSPIGQLLAGKKKGDLVVFNEKSIIIHEIN